MKKLNPCNLEINDIDRIFKRCLARMSSTKIIRTVLFQKEHGFKEDSRALEFDKYMIEISRQELEYSLGQLQDVHENYTSITTDSVKDRYDGVQWTDNTPFVMAYLHLLLAADLIKPMEFSTGEMEFCDTVIPTLLTSDPNIRKWYLQQRKDTICIDLFESSLSHDSSVK